ncbi:MAG: hypothetical protein MJK10_20740 [Pseudomonadales bacterium]|nr:hypothetical protein [Pseudomonadales bacterium]NRA18706.1 hypothetical protein [Oceanospirillaceae bacterium]
MKNVIKVRGQIVAIYNRSGRSLTRTAFPATGRDVVSYVAQLRSQYGAKNVAVDSYEDGQAPMSSITSEECWTSDTADDPQGRLANIRRLEQMIADTDIIERLLGKA